MSRDERWRMGTRMAAVAVIVAALAGVTPAQQTDFSKVEMKATPVAGRVWMLEGLGGNIGVSVGEDGMLIVDDQFAPLADKIRTALKGMGEGRLKYVLNTHYHGDHTGGNPVFGPEAPIIAHHNVRVRLLTETRRGERVTPPMAKEGLPVITYADGLSIHFNGEEIRVLHLPAGHTDGDSIVLFTGSNVVHMGDDFFNGRFPFVDLDAGGDVEGLARNVERLIGELPAGVKVIPGHGSLSDIEGLKKYLAMLSETTSFVRARMKEGKNLDDIKKEGVPEKWTSWSWQFISAETWIETIHKSLTRAGGRS